MMDVLKVEAELATAGVAFVRDWTSAYGWVFIVEGELVATGAAIGLLEQELDTWWKQYGACECPTT